MATRKKSPRLNSLALARLRQTWHEDKLHVTRRSFMVGSAAALAAPIVAKAAGPTSILGGFKVRTRKGRGGKIEQVTVEVNHDATWSIDTALFEGNPVLEVKKEAKKLSIRLTGARFPGTNFNLNLVANIDQRLAGHSLDLSFTDTGVTPSSFKLSGSLEKWIVGTSTLTTSLVQEEAQAIFGSDNLANHSGIRFEGDATVAFTPENSFSVMAPSVLTTPDAQFEVADFIFGVKERSIDTLVGGSTKASTTLQANRRGDWNHAVNVQAESGWTLSGTASGFDRVTSESHETGITGVVLTGSGGLVAKLGDIEFPAEDAQVAQLYGSEPNVIVSTKLADKETWVHRPGLSALLSPRQNLPFVISSDRNGLLVGEPQIEATRVVPKIDDAIVTVTSEDESFPVGFDQQRVIEQRRPITPVPVVVNPAVQNPLTATLKTTSPGLYINFFATLDIVRVADMLNITFELVNMRLTASGATTQITNASSTSPSYMVVTFPPQSISEDTFEDVTQTTAFEPLPPGFATPVKTRLANPTRLVFEIPRTGSVNQTLEGPGGMLDWSTWSPMVAPTAISTYGLNAIVVIDPNWTNVVALPNNMSSDMTNVLKTVDTNPPISARSTQLKLTTTPAVTTLQTAAPVLKQVAANVNTARMVVAIPTKRVAVTRYQTWIEMPAWLAISPSETSTWIHSPAPTPGAPNPIWSTRLAYNSTKGPIWASDDGKWFYVPSPTGFSGPFNSPVELHPTIRAVDAYDYAATPPGPAADTFFALPSITSARRSSIVDGMTPRSARIGGDTPAFEVENLSLTSLGGFLKGDWNYPNAPRTQDVVGWKHIATLGRDHYVKITERGFLYPFMHKCVLITISERKFNRNPSSGEIYAVMRQRRFVLVTQPTVTYDSTTARNLGFSQVTCMSKSTVNLALPASEQSFWMQALSGGPALLTMRGHDMDGNPVTWDQHCAFVMLADGTTANSPAVAGLGDPPSGASDLGGQLVTFAPVDPTLDPAVTPQTCHFPCMNILFTGVSGTTDKLNTPCFRPNLKTTAIRVSAVEAMQTGGNSTPAGPIVAKFADLYKASGFGSGNAGQLIFEIPAKAPAKFGDLKKSGGLVNPDMPMGAISRTQGPIAALADAAGNIPLSAYSSTAGSLSQLSAKILGAVSIWSLLPDPINIGGNGISAPKITMTKVYSTATDSTTSDSSSLTSAVGDVSGILGGGSKVPAQKQVIGAKVELTWKPVVHDWAPFGTPPLFQIQNVASIFNAEKSTFGKDPKLATTPPATGSFSVDAYFSEIFTAGGPKDPAVGSHYSLTAELLWFRINAISPTFSVILVDVQRIGFYASDGQNPQVKIDIPSIAFTGCLKFVETIEKWLGGGSNDVHYPSPDSSSSSPSSLLASTDGGMLVDDGPGFTPIMSVTDAMIEVGGTLTIPDIDCGYFSLSNISFTGTINLPFLGDTFTIDFSFCTQDKPFLLSVDGIAGGGFFLISLSPKGLQKIEASLEFGASVSIDLGVASGGVSLMAGIYFEYDAPTSQTTLTGFVDLKGNLTVIEIISISLEFYLSLSYVGTPTSNVVTGTATLTVEVSILFFSVGVSISVSKSFPGSSNSSDIGNPGLDSLTASIDGALPPPATKPGVFTQGISQPQWTYYCSAFTGAN